MKKFIVSILAMLYMGASIGATIHQHYCMDKLVDWDLWQRSDSKKCGNCGMVKSEEKDNGCCKDEHKHFKLQNDHKAAQNYQVSQLISVSLPVSFFDLPTFKLPSVTEKNPLSHAPPRSSNIAVYLRNCVFLI